MKQFTFLWSRQKDSDPILATVIKDMIDNYQIIDIIVPIAYYHEILATALIISHLKD